MDIFIFVLMQRTNRVMNAIVYLIQDILPCFQAGRIQRGQTMWTVATVSGGIQ